MAASGLLHILHGWEVASSFALALALVMIESVRTKADFAREGLLQQHQLAEFLEPSQIYLGRLSVLCSCLILVWGSRGQTRGYGEKIISSSNNIETRP